MKSTLIRTLVLSACISAVVAGYSLFAVSPAAAVADGAHADGPKRVKMRQWIPAGIELRHLTFREGRRLYRGPRTLQYRWPYLVVATQAERDDGYGWLLEFNTAHELFDPILEPDQALEAIGIFSEGVAIADRDLWKQVAEIAGKFDPKGGWPVKVTKGTPDVFGTRLERVETGFAVRTLRFTCAGYAALGVVAVDYGFPFGGAFQRKSKRWISGPPQCWQTSGEVDHAEQAALHENIQKLRRDIMRCLSKYRKLDEIEGVLARTREFAQLCFELGAPDGMIGSGRQIYRFSLGDGSVVDVVVDRDGHVSSATHARPGPGGERYDPRMLRVAKK